MPFNENIFCGVYISLMHEDPTGGRSSLPENSGIPERKVNSEASGEGGLAKSAINNR